MAAFSPLANSPPAISPAANGWAPQQVDLPTSFTKLNENCGLPDFFRITRFVILVIRPDYQKFCLRSTPAELGPIDYSTGRVRNLLRVWEFFPLWIVIVTYTPVTRRSVNAVTPPRPKQTDCSVTFIILCVAVTRHDFCVTPSRLIEGTAARPSYDSPTNCVTGPRRAHDRHGIIVLIHDRRTTPSRRFQDLYVTLLGYIKS